LPLTNIKIDIYISSLFFTSSEVFFLTYQKIAFLLFDHYNVGDYLYGKEDRLPMQLTAYKVIFQNPQGEMISFEI